MGMFRQTFIGVYNEKEFYELYEKHESAMDERDVDELPFMFGDKKKFINTLKEIKELYDHWLKKGVHSYEYVSSMKYHIDDIIDLIKSDRPIDWPNYFSTIIIEVIPPDIYNG